MDRLTHYLAIPPNYSAALKGLRWSSTGDAVEFGDGSTFAFRAEIFQFLEGYLTQRPLIHLGHILHLFYLLRKPRAPVLGQPEERLVRAFLKAGRSARNAGVFCAVLCHDIPPVPDPPYGILSGVFQLQAGASEPLAPVVTGEAATLPPEVFEARVLFKLAKYDFAEILHWFQHGRGPVVEAGKAIAQAVVIDKPRSLKGVLADLAQRRRLRDAVPFVEQLVGALTLPPRRLERPAMPLGGYSDVTTRGHVEQLLPSQFVFDDLEFVRRHAERELLYFRREEPRQPIREEMIVLLDQGVRAWGSVRLVLTAALFALGQLAERRRIPFRVTATSIGGELLDPLRTATATLEEAIEASDLSAHPGAVLERLLTGDDDGERDLVLLTHPRNLAEAEVKTAARRLRAPARLFAVAVDEHGEGEFSALLAGQPVRRGRFRVDLQRTAPPPAIPAPEPMSSWRGDVEPIAYPFRFGSIAHQERVRFAFDAAGEWLLSATTGGYLHATPTEVCDYEILPRGFVQGAIVADIDQIIGVAGGFVVTNVRPDRVVALHYDFRARTCTAHHFYRTSPTHPPVCFYLRKLHTFCVSDTPKPSCVHLSTGSREMPPAAHAYLDSQRRSCLLPLQGKGNPDTPDSHWAWPQISLNAESGTIKLENVVPPWEEFTPVADNRPVLRGCKVEHADCQGHALAALFTQPTAPPMLRLFRGPRGIPIAEYPHSANAPFTLSSDGRLLARAFGQGRVEIRYAMGAGPLCQVTQVGRFHHNISLELGDGWLIIRINKLLHEVRWNRGPLFVKSGRMPLASVKRSLMEAGLANGGVWARSGDLPPFLPTDAGERFVLTARSNLLAVVSRFGEVVLFDRSGEMLCMFFAFRHQFVAWMPDGTCHGPAALLDRSATPGALEKIASVLRAASENREEIPS